MILLQATSNNTPAAKLSQYELGANYQPNNQLMETQGLLRTCDRCLTVKGDLKEAMTT